LPLLRPQLPHKAATAAQACLSLPQVSPNCPKLFLITSIDSDQTCFAASSPSHIFSTNSEVGTFQ